MSEVLCHANAVSVDGRGALIKGASGSGKSSLSLQLIGLGAELISDDQTHLRVENGSLWASAPSRIAGLIEARGVGILHATYTQAAITVVIDLDHLETDRLPTSHRVAILDHVLPCLHKVDNPAWPAFIMQYLKGSRRDPK